jgi:hypothetical protein
MPQCSPRLDKTKISYCDSFLAPSKQTGWINQQKFISSQFWKIEIQDSGVLGLVSCYASPLFAGSILFMFSQVLCSGFACHWCIYCMS